jgi:hypothetical protein
VGIHQALIGGYSSLVNWEANLLYAGDFTFDIPVSSQQVNDLIIFAAGADATTPNLFTNLSTTTLISVDTNSIEILIEYGVVPDPPFVIDDRFSNTDYGLIMGFRRSGSTSSYNVSIEATNTTATSPSHNNTPVAFNKGDIALLLAFVDDDATPMGAPTDSIKIGEDTSSTDGSIGAAYKQIDTAGNYSWGSWTTTGTDNTVAYVIKIQEA